MLSPQPSQTKQNNMTKIKEIKMKQKAYRKTWSPFCVNQLFLGLGNMVDIPSDTTLKKTYFSLSQGKNNV